MKYYTVTTLRIFFSFSILMGVMGGLTPSRKSNLDQTSFSRTLQKIKVRCALPNELIIIVFTQDISKTDHISFVVELVKLVNEKKIVHHVIIKGVFLGFAECIGNSDKQLLFVFQERYVEFGQTRSSRILRCSKYEQSLERSTGQDFRETAKCS